MGLRAAVGGVAASSETGKELAIDHAPLSAGTADRRWPRAGARLGKSRVRRGKGLVEREFIAPDLILKGALGEVYFVVISVTARCSLNLLGAV